LILELRRHHLRLNRTVVRRTRSILVIIIVVHLALPAEVPGAFMLVCTSIL
jgi:hypothetical protein